MVGFSSILYGLAVHTHKDYLIDFINLNLEKYICKKVLNVFDVQPPSQGLFSLAVKAGVQGFYFFVFTSSLLFFS